MEKALKISLAVLTGWGLVLTLLKAMQNPDAAFLLGYLAGVEVLMSISALAINDIHKNGGPWKVTLAATLILSPLILLILWPLFRVRRWWNEKKMEPRTTPRQP